MSIEFVYRKAKFQNGIKFKEILINGIGYFQKADFHLRNGDYVATKTGAKYWVVLQRSP